MKISHGLLVAAAFVLSVVSARADVPLRKGDQFDLRIAGVPGDETSKSAATIRLMAKAA